MSQKIFVCYRHNDSAGYAGRISDHISRSFGGGSVFRDVDAVAAGDDFVDRIKETLSHCRAFVVVIGRHWLTDPEGRRRFDNPSDYVWLEIRTALARGVRVIPVLVDGSRMPVADELPLELQAVATLNAVEIADSRFEYEMALLIKAIRDAPPPPPRPGTVADPPPPPPEIRLGRSYLGVVLCLPLGALAVSESNKCSAALTVGDIAAARAASQAARKWLRYAIPASFVWWPILLSLLCRAASN